MANDYVSGKWAGKTGASLKADFQKSNNQNTPTLDLNFDEALENVKRVQGKIDTSIKNINKEVKKLYNDKHTGKFAQSYLKNTQKRLNNMKTQLSGNITSMSKGVNTAQKEEWKRLKELLQEWKDAQSKGN